MNTLADFLNMGGYAAFVWSAYGVALAALAFDLLPVLSAERRLLRKLRRRQRSQETRA